MNKAKEKKQPESPVYICSECGKEISGDHVYIKTRRRTELHIHFGCMPGERGKELEANQCKGNISTMDTRR